MEPKFCNDFAVTYNGTCFHLHRCILARESVYFNNLLESTPDCMEIEIPIQHDYEKLALVAAEFQDFFECLYQHKALQMKDVFTFEPEPEPIHFFSALLHFSHYFQAERLETQLQPIVLEAAKTCPTHSVESLYCAVIYHYQVIKDELIQIVVCF